MAFDLLTARPYKPQGFDISTARAPGAPTSPPETRPRAEVEAELAQRQAASAAADADLARLEPLERIVRPVAQTLTGLASGVVGLPGMVEEGVEGAINLMGKARGREMPALPRVFRGPTDFLNPAELAPRNVAEQINVTGSNFLGGALTGVGGGRELAARATSPVTRAVGEVLADNPGRQLIGAGTGTAAVEATRAAGGGPFAQTVAGVVGAGAPMAGAKPNAVTAQPSYPKVVADTRLGRARAAGFMVDPSNAARVNILDAPPGQAPRTSGLIEQGLAGAPEVRAHMAMQNSKQANIFARRDLGLADDTPLNERTLDMAAGRHEAVYDKVRDSVPVLVPDDQLRGQFNQLGEDLRNNPALGGNPEIDQLRARLMTMDSLSGADAVMAIRQWRKRAGSLFKSLGEPAKEEMAFAYREAADALEDALGRAAAKNPTVEPGLIDAFRAARTELAKINDVRDALVGEDIDPRVLVKLAEKGKLTGHLKLIADVATDFPDLMLRPNQIHLPTRDIGGLLSTVKYGARRLGGQRLIPHLMSDRFQGKYGEFDPNYQTGLLQEYFGSDLDNPFPPRPAAEGVQPGTGPVDYSPTPGVPPAAALRNPNGLGTELVPDPVPGAVELPPAENLAGDLTASTPPMGGSIPAQDLGVADALAGLLDVAPPTRGDIPYQPANPPANPPAGMQLGEEVTFRIPGPAMETPDVALPGPLDENMAGLGIPPGGALPFAESVGAPPAVQTRPEAMRVGEQLSADMELVPGPVDNPDVLPPPPDMGGGLDFAPRPEPGADVIEFTPEMLDPDALAGLLDLVQGNAGLDFSPGDLQLGGRGRTLNPERRNMPRAGGRGTTADDLSLAEDLVPREPLALPAPAPLRGTDTGMVGTPEQFDELGMGTPGARAAAQGELLPRDAELGNDLIDVTPQREPELELAEPMPPPDDVRGRYREQMGRQPIPPGAEVIEPPTRDGYLAYRKRDDGPWRIGSAFVEQNSRRKGVMQGMMHRLVKEAADAKAQLDSDFSISKDQLRVYRAMRDKGIIEFDGDLDAAWNALDEFDKADNPSGKSWFTNIRLGPAG